MPFEFPGSTPRRHVAPKLVCLSRRVSCGHDRTPHHLLLKERYAERAFEHRHQTRVWISDVFFPIATAQIGMHHAAGNRSWPHDADLDDEVVIALRTKTRQHRHLRARLDLKNTDGLAPAD